MPKQEDQVPVVTYESVKGQEKEAQDGLDRAFDLLFDDVLKTKWAECRKAERAARPSKVDS